MGRRSSIETPQFDRWLDAFFDGFFRQHPVTATFIGSHEFDHELPDYSAAGVEQALTDLATLAKQESVLPPEPLSETDRIDRRLATGFITLRRFELESGRMHLGNPSLYTGEAIFGVMSLFLAEFAPLAERVRTATARLAAIAGFLQTARDNLRAAPGPWCDRARAECEAALRFLGDDALAAAGSECTDHYRRSAAQAAAAFRAFRAHLDALLAAGGSDPVGCGAEALGLHLEHAHCLRQSASEIAAYAADQLGDARARLAERCTALGGNNPRQLLDSLAALHPDTSSYYASYRETWERMRSLAVANDLLTWPDFPIRYVPQPAWARAAAPDLYFLNYRSPAAYNRPPVHDYLVTPIDDSMPAALQRSRLRANNDCTIKLNHVVHHGGIGHHVQNWHAFRAGSRIARIAAVDGASRIALHCGGTMAEGWACYATDLIAEFGGMTPLEEFAEIHTRIRMCARAIVDVGFHCGELTFADAVGIYEREAGMSHQGAVYEATRNSMYPATALMYVAGCDAIHALRRELQARPGGAFSLRDFHDTFLSYGSIPVALVAESMRQRQNRAA